MADAEELDVLELEIPTGEAEVPGDDLTPAPEGDEEEVVVEFEGDDGAAPAQSEEKDTSLVRHLREQLREKERRLAAFEKAQQPKPVEVGEKPTFEGCEYDEARFEEELDAWKERKAQAERQTVEAEKSQRAQKEAWDRRLAEVEAEKAKLNAKDYDRAAEDVKATFDELQQAMIVRATKNPARMIYALGKAPHKAAELAKITDPVEFIAELARLEGKVTMTTQRKAPPPEQIARGSAPLSAGTDKHLERLEKEAERSGDRTAVIAYRRQLRAKAK
jgi:hypothetical protein